MLGAFLAILSAASFAATKAAATRGVVTGTPAQGMVLTNPVGVVTLVLAVVLLGEPCTMLQMMGGAPSSRSACVRRLRRLLCGSRRAKWRGSCSLYSRHSPTARAR